jgi:hypothetical protein
MLAPHPLDGIEPATRHCTKRSAKMTSTTGAAVSRRTALASLSAGGLGLALGATAALPVAAQDATPATMAGHPLVGAWMVDRVPNDPTDMPTANIISSDGTVSDPIVGGAGIWQPTGPSTANFTLAPLAEVPAGMQTVRHDPRVCARFP